MQLHGFVDVRGYRSHDAHDESGNARVDDESGASAVRRQPEIRRPQRLGGHSGRSDRTEIHLDQHFYRALGRTRTDTGRILTVVPRHVWSILSAVMELIVGTRNSRCQTSIGSIRRKKLDDRLEGQTPRSA
jgi:hypothetical protein